jgi:sugar-specific transcriptional regulator TrmB
VGAQPTAWKNTLDVHSFYMQKRKNALQLIKRAHIMRDNERHICTLVDLGLNRTQARIYLALIEKGISTIRTIAEYSGIGRPDIYRAVLELKQIGLVETILSSPTKYKPIPLSEAISFLMKSKQKKMTALVRKTDELLIDYQKKSLDECSNFDSQFILIPEGVTSIKKARAAIQTARSNIEFITSFKRFNQLLSAASKDITEAVNRGVKVRFLVDKSTVNEALLGVFLNLSNSSCCKIKYLPELTHSFIAVYDNKEVQMATSADDDDFIQALILWSNNPALVKVMQNYFESVWFSQSTLWVGFEEETQFQ